MINLILACDSQVRNKRVCCDEQIMSSDHQVMVSLTPEDIQAIISGVANNQDLIAGVVSQLKKTVNSPLPPVQPTSESAGGSQMNPASLSRPGEGQEPSQQVPIMGGGQSLNFQLLSTHSMRQLNEGSTDQLLHSSSQEPPLSTQGWLVSWSRANIFHQRVSWEGTQYCIIISCIGLFLLVGLRVTLFHLPDLFLG